MPRKSLEHIIHSGTYLPVPKSHYPVSLLVKLGGPRSVLLLLSLFGMLTAVEFDNQAPLDAAFISSGLRQANILRALGAGIADNIQIRTALRQRGQRCEQ